MFTMVSNLVNKPNSFLIKTILFTGLALIAFAANSVLCRLALGGSAIDASTFTIVRLLSGVIVLTVILNISKINSNSSPSTKGSWPASIALFIYAIYIFLCICDAGHSNRGAHFIWIGSKLQ